MPLTPDYDGWCSRLIESAKKRYPNAQPGGGPLVLTHSQESVYEGPAFPSGRIDFFSSDRFTANDGTPIKTYIGLQTMQNVVDTDDYVCTVLMTLAFQEQDARKSETNPFPVLDWVKPAPLA